MTFKALSFKTQTEMGFFSPPPLPQQPPLLILDLAM